MSKGTPIRNVRVPDELWGLAQEKAIREGINLSAVIREALRNYINESEKT